MGTPVKRQVGLRQKLAGVYMDYSRDTIRSLAGGPH